VPIAYRGPAVFLPNDPPRSGLVALLDPDGGARTTVSLVLPLDAGPRRTRLPATVMPMRLAVPWLAGLDADGAEPSLAALAAAARAALAMVARGRLHPSWTRAGADCWRVGPLDSADTAWVEELSEVLPLLLRAVPAGPSTDWVWSPQALIREFWDAIADALVRTAAADLGRGVLPFSSRVPVPVTALRPWLRSLDPERDARARPGLRLEIPDDPAAPTAVVAFVRSTVDPAVAVDLSDLDRLDPAAARTLGPQAALDLLDGLRAAEAIWPPVARLLDAPFPDRVALADADLDSLLAGAAGRLEAEGVDVVLPDGIEAASPVDIAAVAEGSWDLLAEGVFTLGALCDFRWEPSLDGEALDEREIAMLRAATRPLVQLRGRWVRTDPGLRSRLARRRHRLQAGEALAAALTGTVDADGQIVAVRSAGALAAIADRVRALTDPAAVPPPPGLRATLRPYQLRGLAWLAATCELGLGGCLADDMGLGKTVQVIALHLHRSRGPLLVVCPASLLGTWERELHRFAPGLPVRRYHGGERHLRALRETEVVLVTYALARRDTAILAEVPWDLVVADEAQHVKNPASAGARAMRRLNARARVALTGTPIENRLSDLWAILDWTTPGLLGTLEGFRRKVARPVERGSDEEVARRFARTIRPFLLRRRKSDPDIAPELPPRTEVDLVVGMTAEQSALYEAVVQDTLAAIRGARGMARRGLVLRLLTALKQVCNHPAQYLRQEGPLRGRSGKLDALDELLDVIVAEGESTLVFTQYVAMARLLEAHLAARGLGTAFLHGGVPVKRREDMVDRFQAGEVPVFLLSLRAGGVGLTLTRATHVIHYDRWWNPAVEDQATDRAHRIGQDAPVEIHRLITEGTLEDRIAELLSAKRALADSVIGAGEGWISEMSDDELAELVALQRVA
jgi:SNF2 domain-containing protein/helicase-like protein/SNF2 helicase protein